MIKFNTTISTFDKTQSQQYLSEPWLGTLWKWFNNTYG